MKSFSEQPVPADPASGRLAMRTIFALGWVSFFMDVSSEMVYPLLPVFLSSVLGAGGTTIGFIGGLSESTASFFRVAAGVISDRIRKRKSAVILGYGVSALARPLLALAAAWGHVLAFRLIDRAGKGIRTPPRDALIADAVPASRYGRSYGIQRAMDTAGAVVGPALAAWILSRGSGYRSIFWLSAIPAVASVAIARFFVREHAAGRIAQSPRRTAEGGRIPFSRELKIFLAVTAVFSLGNSSNFFLVLRAKNLGVAASLIPALYLTMNVAYALFSYPAGRLADRFGKARVAFIGYFLYAGAYASFAAVGSGSMLWLLFPFYGLYLGFTDGVGTAYLATLLPPDRRATGFAAYHTVIGICLLPASTFGGWLWDRYSPPATFIAGSALSVVAGVLFGILLLRRGRRAR